MAGLIISVSGLRGIVGETLTDEVAARFARAFSESLPAGAVVVSRDGRSHGPGLARAIQASLVACGRTVIDAGIAATPTLGVLVRHLAAAGGLQISASHNPPEYNGIKLFGTDGRVIGAEAGAAVKQRYETLTSETASGSASRSFGAIRVASDVHGPHLEKVLAQVDVEAIQQRKFKVLLDSNAGSGSLLGSRLLETLGCEVVMRGGAADGVFLHPPEPTATNLKGIADEVAGLGVDVGFCQDPDADRLAVIDEQGTYIGEEYTLALCLADVLPRRRGPVVINCATSRMNEDIATKLGCKLLRSKVGEANVCDLMIAQQAVFGGEGSGGPIDPQVGYVRDSFVGMATILSAMATRRKTVSQLVAEIPRYEIHKTQMQLPEGTLEKALDAVARTLNDAKHDWSDGLRIDYADRWLIVRGSNTEPMVRLIAEAKTLAAAVALCDEGRAAIEAALGM